MVSIRAYNYGFEISAKSVKKGTRVQFRLTSSSGFHGIAIPTLAATRPALLLTGVRQSGKSSLLKKIFPRARHVSLDKITTALSAEENPAEFLGGFAEAEQAILDEIQYAPSLFRQLKIIIDEDREKYGKWILTGSQKFSLMKNARESLASRIALLHLGTLSAGELR